MKSLSSKEPLDDISTFEFQIKRGNIDISYIEEEQIKINKIIKLYKAKKFEKGNKEILNLISFKCNFKNLDCGAEKIIVNPKEINLNCTSKNTTIQGEYLDNELQLTVTVQFKVETQPELSSSKIQEILTNQGGWSCATINPIEFKDKDGCNMWII